MTTVLSSPVHDRTSVVHAGHAVPATDSAGRSHQEKGHGTAARSEDTQTPGSVTPPYGAGTPPVEPAHASTTAGLPGATRAAS